MLAEVEPFKTTFLVGWFRALLALHAVRRRPAGLSIFVERPFCKYLCPLGASLAMPSTFRWFGLCAQAGVQQLQGLRRTAAASQAIDADGRIDHRECLLCLDCMILYTDAHACPPLAKERKRREGRPAAHADRARRLLHPDQAGPGGRRRAMDTGWRLRAPASRVCSLRLPPRWPSHAAAGTACSRGSRSPPPSRAAQPGDTVRVRARPLPERLRDRQAADAARRRPADDQRRRATPSA